jgi:hypothetical protein
MQQPMGAPPGGAPMVRAGAHGPIGNVRNPIVVTLLCYVTCGVYALFWIWSTVNELKAFRQREDINPILFFIPILSIIQIWQLPEKVLEAKQMAGVPNPQVPHPVLYLMLSPYFFTSDLNEVWQTAGGGQSFG